MKRELRHPQPAMRQLLLIAFVVKCAFASTVPATADAILIVGVSPTPFVDGKEVDAAVTVVYDLKSADEATIDLSSNELRAQTFRPVAHIRVKKGTNTVTVSGKLTPRVWSAVTPAKVAVDLWIDDLQYTRRALASDEKRLSVARRVRQENDRENPGPSIVYDDSVSIKSVAPENLIEGKETEIAVTVTYELFSRDEGELNLGFNEGRGSGYTIVGSTRVKIGAGETVVRARIVPSRTGSLPLAKLFVNLSEYPHRKSWSPLAGDSQTVEVR